MKEKARTVAIVVIALVAGILLGRFSVRDVTENLPSSKRLVDYDEIGRSMYVHQDSCVQEYQDGLKISEEISDSFLRKKFLQQRGYVTHLDVALSKSIWVENCMHQKEIYNRVGLGR